MTRKKTDYRKLHTKSNKSSDLAFTYSLSDSKRVWAWTF